MTKIVADFSLNHLGDQRLIEAMIKTAKECGVDAVKFQSWRAEKLRKDYPHYQYHYDRHLKTQLNDDDYKFIIKTAKDYGIEWFTSVFDIDMVDYLADLGLKTIKIASPDANSWGLLEKCLSVFDHVIISTGMHTKEELEKLIEFLIGRQQKITLMHCTSIYPTPLECLNLNTMMFYMRLGFDAGLSDHTMGTDAGKQAISLGAKILEKHFTLSRSMPGMFQEMAATPEELKELVEWKQKTYQMMGHVFNKLSKEQLNRRAEYIGKWGDNK